MGKTPGSTTSQYDQTSLCFVRTDLKLTHLNEPHYKRCKIKRKAREADTGRQRRRAERPLPAEAPQRPQDQRPRARRGGAVGPGARGAGPGGTPGAGSGRRCGDRTGAECAT